jgi:hypothetical protein
VSALAQDDENYTQIGLRDWPFHVVASEATADIWVGRDELKRKVSRLQRSASRVSTSQIVLMWASFGAGKTHALMFLRRLASTDEKLEPLYVVTPRGIRNFVDLYRAISTAAIESGAAAAAGRRILLQDSLPNSDVERALRQLASGDNEGAQLAASWLRAERTTARDRQALGLAGTLDTPTGASEGLQKLVHALQSNGSRLVLLLDEVQELAELGRKLDECVGGLHKLFDSTPHGLTLVLSFTTGSQGTLRAILGDTLWDRVGQTIALPALTEQEGVEFVTGLLDVEQLPEGPTQPFAAEAVAEVVRQVAAGQALLTPRSLIRAADRVLREALPDLEDGVRESIDAEFVREILDGSN